jgi:hypothetical protein
VAGLNKLLQAWDFVKTLHYCNCDTLLTNCLFQAKRKLKSFIRRKLQKFSLVILYQLKQITTPAFGQSIHWCHRLWKDLLSLLERIGNIWSRQYNDYGSVSRDASKHNFNSVDFSEFQEDTCAVTRDVMTICGMQAQAYRDVFRCFERGRG